VTFCQGDHTEIYGEHAPVDSVRTNPA
jgi:hypothetical protein